MSRKRTRRHRVCSEQLEVRRCLSAASIASAVIAETAAEATDTVPVDSFSINFAKIESSSAARSTPEMTLNYEDIDVVYSRMGEDLLIVNNGDGSDFLEGQDGSDLLIVNNGDGSDFLEGGDGVDVLRGGAGNDVLLSSRGNDILLSRDGVLPGEDGDDLLIVNNGDGSDTVEGHDGNDVLIGNRRNDFVFGEDGNDLLIVNTGDGSDFQDEIGAGGGPHVRIFSGVN